MKKQPRKLHRRIGRGLETLESRHALATFIDGFAETTLATDLNRPTAMAVAPDGRVFVTEQDGAVRIIKNDSLLATPFLTRSVNSEGERGLLGIAFDPAFETNNFVYVYYTTPNSPIHNRVSRFTALGDVALPGSETVLLDLDNLSAARNHNGGAIHFGPDGKLYIAVGENGNANNSQTLGNLLGKMLRINPTPGNIIPADNPFVGTPGARGEIWALGFRNPYTFSVQPNNGRIYVNDVGQNTWEEINELVPGGNYGWPNTEGPTTNPNFISPVFAYQHDTGTPQGAAITGGAFYNPAANQFPASFVGDYFFADVVAGFIYKYDLATDTATEFATGLAQPVDLQVDGDGELLYLARRGGELRAVRYVNVAPKVEIQGDITFTKGQAPILIAAGAIVTDADSPKLGGGQLRVSIPAGSTPTERFAIRTAGKISVNGTKVFYNGFLIGHSSGGTGSPLVVSLINNAAPFKVQELLRNITYVNSSSDPAALTRTISVQLSDGDFGQSRPDTKRIVLTSADPVLDLGGVIGYRQNANPIQIVPGATVSDSDSDNFARGILTVQIISGGTSANRLFIGGPFTKSGQNILLNGQTIGVLNNGGGTGLVKLQITLTSNATQVTTQQLLRAIRFRTINNDTFVKRVIAFTLTDGDGGESVTLTKKVNVTT